VLQAAGVAPLSCQQFDGLSCIENMSGLSPDADGNHNRLGKPSLVHGGTFDEWNPQKRVARRKVSSASVTLA
jgi:hypothetical protein